MKIWQASTYSRSLYDAFYLYALGLNRTLAVDPVNGLRNSALLKQSLAGTFSGNPSSLCILHSWSSHPINWSWICWGMTGDVTITINSTRAPLFSVVAMDTTGVVTGYFNVTVDSTVMSLSVGCIRCAVSVNVCDRAATFSYIPINCANYLIRTTIIELSKSESENLDHLTFRLIASSMDCFCLCLSHLHASPIHERVLWAEGTMSHIVYSFPFPKRKRLLSFRMHMSTCLLRS